MREEYEAPKEAAAVMPKESDTPKAEQAPIEGLTQPESKEAGPSEGLMCTERDAQPKAETEGRTAETKSQEQSTSVARGESGDRTTVVEGNARPSEEVTTQGAQLEKQVDGSDTTQKAATASLDIDVGFDGVSVQGEITTAEAKGNGEGGTTTKVETAAMGLHIGFDGVSANSEVTTTEKKENREGVTSTKIETAAVGLDVGSDGYSVDAEVTSAEKLDNGEGVTSTKVETAAVGLDVGSDGLSAGSEVASYEKQDDGQGNTITTMATAAMGLDVGFDGLSAGSEVAVCEKQDDGQGNTTTKVGTAAIGAEYGGTRVDGEASVFEDKTVDGNIMDHVEARLGHTELQVSLGDNLAGFIETNEAVAISPFFDADISKNEHGDAIKGEVAFNTGQLAVSEKTGGVEWCARDALTGFGQSNDICFRAEVTGAVGVGGGGNAEVIAGAHDDSSIFAKIPILGTGFSVGAGMTVSEPASQKPAETKLPDADAKATTAPGNVQQRPDPLAEVEQLLGISHRSDSGETDRVTFADVEKMLEEDVYHERKAKTPKDGLVWWE